MARINHDEPVSIQIHQSKQRQDPIKAEVCLVDLESTAEKASNKIFLILFILHLILLTILIIFLAIRGVISSVRIHCKNLRLHWYPPLLSASALAALAAFACQVAIRKITSKSIRLVFWLSPLLTCAVGVLFLSIGTLGGFGAAAFSIIFALIQSLYGCWVVPRMDHATRILSLSLSTPTPKATIFLIISLLIGTIYSCLAASGLGGINQTPTRFDPLYIFAILASLTWTMQVIRNTLLVSISKPVYIHFTNKSNDADVPIKHSMGRICLGSILSPVIEVFRAFARVMILVAGGTDEFMFSCANCYSGVADRVVVYGNRWGFVHLGVNKKGFVRASVDTWEMFEKTGMKPLIDLDLTGTICFLSGVAGGSLCAVVAGSWTLAVHKDYAMPVSFYAFLIGYFMMRVAMSWPQACVSAYYVAFAENPQSLQFDTTIPRRIQELQRCAA